ncbi:Cupin, RmlC-type [Penicillium camemberti]|uniref:Cupin, RmlC-type n=1 Tax=Penicillium camemberti (strain FM 013) TaxID=1429867 RepID=A0A0G4P6M0_PENC3|nr:Cupin, RmlC-type [Penicillium camemberti]
MSSKVYADIYATEGPFTQFPGAGLPDIKRFITTHNAQGEGVFLPVDNGDHQALMANGRGCQNILYTTQGEAVDLNGEVDIALAKNNAPGLHVPGGTLVRMIDFAPGVESPMHRAMSLDYGTVIEGEFEVELDSGEKRIMRRGDVLVQRATAHRWRNLSPDKPGRMLFVLLDCQPMDPINGKEFAVELNELSPDFEDNH